MDVAVLTIAAVSWIGVSLLAYFLGRIARFYERSSGETAHSWLFSLPMLLLPAGAACYLIYDTRFVGIAAGDLLLFAGGISLLLASALLQQIMMGER